MLYRNRYVRSLIIKRFERIETFSNDCDCSFVALTRLLFVRRKVSLQTAPVSEDVKLSSQ